MLLEKIETLIGSPPATVDDILYILAFIFMVWLADRLVSLLISFFNK